MVQRPDSCTRADGFQSLSGFLMSCNRNDPHLVGSVSQFQSLSGFLMSCNGAGEGIPAGRTGRFQSLSGFLMSCNLVGARVECANGIAGFNPYRVF